MVADHPHAVGGSATAAADPMAAAAAAGAAGGPRTSPTVCLLPANAIRAAHEPRERVSRARPGVPGVARGRPQRAPARSGRRGVGLRGARVGRGDDPALERLRARESRAAMGLARSAAHARRTAHAPLPTLQTTPSRPPQPPPAAGKHPCKSRVRPACKTPAAARGGRATMAAEATARRPPETCPARAPRARSPHAARTATWCTPACAYRGGHVGHGRDGSLTPRRARASLCDASKVACQQRKRRGAGRRAATPAERALNRCAGGAAARPHLRASLASMSSALARPP